MFIHKMYLLNRTVISSVAARLRPSPWQIRYAHSRPEYAEHIESRIGNREMVGHGINGQPFYADHSAFPFPAIRYKEPTPEIMALREKEKGDWRLLSIKEKKELYRAAYCQTFAEFQHFTSEWMYILGWTLINISMGIWLYIGFHVFVYTEYPPSFEADAKKAQLRRMIDLHVNPITGLASNWDYEKKDWKKKGWFTPNNPFDEDDEEEEEEDTEKDCEEPRHHIAAPSDDDQGSRR